MSTWIKGIHTFKCGYDLRMYPVQLYDPQQLTINATQNFTGGSLTRPQPPPIPAAASPICSSAAASVTSGYVNSTHSHREYYGLYLQDTMRLLRNLTADVWPAHEL